MDIPLEQLDGVQFAIVLSRTDDDSHTAVIGVALVQDGELFVRHDDRKPLFPIPKHVFDQIKPCNDEARRTLEADYWVHLRVDPITADLDRDAMQALGIEWPE